MLRRHERSESARSYEMDDYGKEALDITVDYLDLLGGNKVAVGRPRRRPVAAVSR